MKVFRELLDHESRYLTRRHFLRQGSLGLGAAALGSLAGCQSLTDPMLQNERSPAKAKTIIFLHMAGAPSQLELFDYKPLLQKLDGQPCPDSLLAGKRFAFIRGVPDMLGPQFSFDQYGASGSWVSELLPNFKEVVDDVLFTKALYTEEFNHGPAQLFMHTGSPRLGRPSFGSWVTYGLGSENENLPGFIVLVSGQSAPSGGKSLWGSGFLPSVYQGVEFRSKGDPVLYMSNPDGVTRDIRKDAIEAINNINARAHEEVNDPEILTRMAQYEMAFKMQMTVPEATNLSEEPAYIHEMYGTAPGEISFANNCLLARRLAERGVRFIQLYHRGWDSHGSNDFESLHGGFLKRVKEVDQPMTALIRDLKQRGMLEDTLVVWGGEFGRTPMQENRQGITNRFKGRDHHGNAFTMWMTGGGLKTGITYGETDEIGYDGISGRIHIHDLQATLLHQLGIDHEKLTYHFQGRDFRLTDVHGHIVQDILA
ncbi:MAG: DUF1501 domain-containing protein [Saprospiraceae bacterium]|nr:DUF1501 domain-containing protein [Saprospiraceae bacterium]